MERVFGLARDEMAWGGTKIDPFDRQIYGRATVEAQTISMV
jgi:hypothetical protein